MRRTRRSTGCIHFGHLPERYDNIDEYWRTRIVRYLWKDHGYTAGAFALEVAPSTGAHHIHFYVEHGQKSAGTLARQFDVSQEAVFYDTVRSPQGIWDYCTGGGKHDQKEFLERFMIDAKPTLFGGGASATTLKWCVDELLAGQSPMDLMRTNTYAYCVHRTRIWHLYHDLNEVEATGRLTGPGEIPRPS